MIEAKELQPLEDAARELCAMEGVDPEEMQQEPHPQGLMVMVPVKNWVLRARSLHHFNMHLVALKRGQEAKAAREAAADDKRH